MGSPRMRSPIILVAFFLLIPVAFAGFDGEFTVDGLSLDGEGSLYGNIAAFHLRGGSPDVQGVEQGGTELISLHLTGEKISIETGHSARNLTAFSVAVTPNYGWTTFDEFDDATLVPSRIDPHFDIYITPAPDRDPAAAAFQGNDLVITAGSGSTTRTSYLASNDREPIVTDTSHLHSIGSGDDARLRLDGDFRLILWNLDFSITDHGGTQEFWTGDQRDPYIDGADAGPNRAESRESYITIQNGSMELDTGTSSMQLFMTADNAWAATAMELHDAVPLHTNPQAPRDRTVPGPVLAGLSSVREDAFTVGAPRASEAAEIFDAPLGVQGTGTAAPAMSLWITAAWTVPIVILGAAAVAWRIPRHRQRQLMVSLTQAMDDADYRRVVNDAPPLLRVPRFAPEAVIMCGVSLLRLGRDQEVLDLLEDTPEKLRPQPAACHYLLACALAQMRRHEEAKEKIQRCLEMDPSFSVEIMNNPTIARLLGGSTKKAGAASEGYA